MTDPTARIPELAILLKPVKDKVQEVLNAQIYQVRTKSEEVRDKVAIYVTSAHADIRDRLNLNEITQEIEKIANSGTQVASIDSAIARQTEIEKLLTPLLAKIDRQAEEIIQHQHKAENIYQTELPKTKSIVSVQVAKIAPKLVLETSQDVDAYLEVLRQTLLDKIQQNNRVRLE